MVSNKYLSKTYASWYSRIFEEKRIHVGLLKETEHPHRILQVITENTTMIPGNTIKITYVDDMETANPRDNEIYTKSKLLAKYLNNRRFEQVIAEALPVTTGRLFLGNMIDNPHLLICDKSNAFIMVRAGDSLEYLSNYYKIKRALASANTTLKVIDDIGLLKFGSDYYFISKFMGYDYETLLLDFKKQKYKNELLQYFKELEELGNVGIFFRNNAPRNIIRNDDGTSYVIDFDNVYSSEDSKGRYITKLLEKRVWFADIFSEEVINHTLYNLDLLPSTAKLPVGEFEKKFFNTDEPVMSLDMIQYINSIIVRFEKFDRYNNIDIYGHELGRFISDIWKLDNEVLLHKYIEGIDDKELSMLRANLFLLSRLDQELLLRKTYGVDMETKLFSERYFKLLHDGNLQPTFLDFLVPSVCIKQRCTEMDKYL